MRKLILNCRTNNMDEFKKLCEFAADTGITHVAVSQVEKSIWQWNQNRNDPYPNWGMGNTSIFKIIVPDELKPYLPTDYAERNMETIIKRAEILKEYGLKAIFEGMEPAYLPEQAYLDHPAWRGPRCDQPRRARAEYYAPCTDNPEIQKMYDESVYKLVKNVPIEFFRFLTNDSGGGICWSERLYPGANGPQSCKNKSVADKAVDFLTLIQNAALRAGINAEVGYARNFTDGETAAIRAKLKDGQFCYEFTNKESAKVYDVGYQEHQDPTFPIRNIPMVNRIADQIIETIGNDESNIYFRFPSVECSEYLQFIKDNFGKMQKSTIGKYEALKKTASNFVGEKYADLLVDIWDKIDKAQSKALHLNQGGHMAQLGSVHQRWVTRPLVAFQSELTDEEKSYYRPYLFQAGTEKDAENLVNMQASIWLGGDSAKRLLRMCMESCIAEIQKALNILNDLIAKDDIGEYKNELNLLKLKLKMYICMMKNAVNVVGYQAVMDTVDFEAELEDDSYIPMDEQGDKRFYKVNEIVRAEIDNTCEMIELLEAAEPYNLFICTDTEEDEDIMHFGPEIKKDLLKKVQIMEKHRHDFTRLFATYNR